MRDFANKLFAGEGQAMSSQPMARLAHWEKIELLAEGWSSPADVSCANWEKIELLAEGWSSPTDVSCANMRSATRSGAAVFHLMVPDALPAYQRTAVVAFYGYADAEFLHATQGCPKPCWTRWCDTPKVRTKTPSFCKRLSIGWNKHIKSKLDGVALPISVLEQRRRAIASWYRVELALCKLDGGLAAQPLFALSWGTQAAAASQLPATASRKRKESGEQPPDPVLNLEPVPSLAPEPPRRPPASAHPAHLAVYEAYVAIYDAVALERNRVQCLNANRRKRHNAILMKLGQTSNSIMPAGVRIKLEPEIEEQPPPMPPDAWVKLEFV